MAVYSHISTIFSGSWVAWTLLALLVLLLVNPSQQTNLLVGLRNIFSQSERIYVYHTSNWGNDIITFVFRIGVMAMAFMVLLIPLNLQRFVVYAQMMGMVAAVCLCQKLLMYVLGKVFISQKHLDLAVEQYNVISMMMSVALYPVLLIITNIPSTALAWILCGGILLLFVVGVFSKGIQLFYSSSGVLSIFYMLLYITFLELIPIGAIISATNHILRV